MYPELDQLFGAYVNQDYQVWGDTLQEVVNCYKADSTEEERGRMLEEIAQFSRTNSADLDAAFSARYGFDFDPHLWGHTTASFFELVQRVLSQNDDA